MPMGMLAHGKCGEWWREMATAHDMHGEKCGEWWRVMPMGTFAHGKNCVW